MVIFFLYTQYTDAGTYTCNQGGRDHKIPGSYGHYKQDASTYADWGVECKKCSLVSCARLHMHTPLQWL